MQWVYSLLIKQILKKGLELVNLRVVTTEEGEKFAKEQELLYYEVSAKEGTNVQQTFKNLALKLFAIQDVD